MRMSNMYASAFKWEDVMKVRKGMEERRGWRCLGVFVMDDQACINHLTLQVLTFETTPIYLCSGSKLCLSLIHI